MKQLDNKPKSAINSGKNHTYNATSFRINLEFKKEKIIKKNKIGHPYP